MMRIDKISQRRLDPECMESSLDEEVFVILSEKNAYKESGYVSK